MRKVYEQLAGLADAYHNCIKANNTTWQAKHLDKMVFIAHNHLPSGSGIDSGCTIDAMNSNGNRLFIHSAYHTMNENGMYDRWIDFTVTVKPSLHLCLDLTIKGNFGRDQDLKDYLYDVFHYALMKEII